MYEILKENNNGLKNLKFYSLFNEFENEVDSEKAALCNEQINISDDVIMHSMISLWDNKLSTGIVNIDNQHKELFNLINRLVIVINEKKSKNEIRKVFNSFEKYIIRHFNEEEAIQKQYNYPWYITHHQQHEEFKKQLNDLRDIIEKRGISVLFTIQMKENLFKWLRKHIMNLDRNLGEFLIKKCRGL